jgi:hypothetical protein
MRQFKDLLFRIGHAHLQHMRAPCALAICKRGSAVSITITSRAPLKRVYCVTSWPNNPAPMMTTESPNSCCALRTAGLRDVGHAEPCRGLIADAIGNWLSAHADGIVTAALLVIGARRDAVAHFPACTSEPTSSTRPTMQ